MLHGWFVIAQTCRYFITMAQTWLVSNISQILCPHTFWPKCGENVIRIAQVRQWSTVYYFQCGNACYHQ